MQLAALQQMLTGQQNGGSGEQAPFGMGAAAVDPLAMFNSFGVDGNAQDLSQSGSEKDVGQILSDEEFKKDLSGQELMIWNAMVIAIHQ